MKKRLSLLLILGLLLPVLLTTSCQTAEQTSDKTVALKFVRIGNDAAEATYWKRLIGDFNQANPGIKVEYDDAAIGEPMETKLNSMFSAGLGPDIIGHGILSVAARVEAGHYQPITTYFNSWEGKDDLMAAVLANGTYKNEIYGLAYSTTPFIFAWRKDFFSDAGLDPEKAPQNWEELESFSRQLTKKDAAGQITQSGFAFPRSAGNFVEFDTLVFGNGGLYYNDQGEPTLNTPDKVETLEFLAGFVNDVGIPFNSNETNPFIAGTAAMTLINNVALTPMLKNEAYAGKVGIALPPANKTPATFSGCNMLFVGGDCKQPDEAFQFIAYALTKEEVLTRAKELGIPVTRQSQVDAFIALDPMNAVRAECVAKGVGMPRATWSTTFQKIRNDLVQQVLYGKMNAADALAQAQADLEAEIAAP
ncbi:MAG: extracellular solute-binding protein [Clostridiaceae bacterium]|nr:extracellular solute-binding protein [Eubacteriales bacterium]NLB44745.1 extracellular solute-binding protein [Clostridiaceae bacterium]